MKTAGVAFLAIMLLPAAVLADQPYKDLPGVKVPAPLNAPSDYRCESTTIITRSTRNRDSVFPSENLPVAGYRCEKNGIVTWGTGAPPTDGWYPGINPRDLSP